ncbi:hypothetical protein JD969_07935 [Planctomycetota bacterium]|nr:hypothetical protein JD969_07935 [Planctomycetota bacterium]
MTYDKKQSEQALCDAVMSELYDDTSNQSIDEQKKVRAVLDMLAEAKDENTPALSDDFGQRVAWGIENELGEQIGTGGNGTSGTDTHEPVIGHINKRGWGLGRWLKVSGAAAVIGLTGLAWLSSSFLSGSSGGSNVVWADVVDAVQEVKEFHMTYFADEPRAMTGPKMVRGDVYFQWPNKWRAQGMGYVQFSNEEGTKIYNIKDGRFESPEETAFGLLNQRFLKHAEKGRLLEAILEILFGDEAVSAKAVRANQNIEAAGIAVFDYAVDPTVVKARIWVIEDSKLPIRIKMHYPESEDFVLIDFDYTMQMPNKFFNVERFAKEMWSKEAYEAYKWGMKADTAE